MTRQKLLLLLEFALLSSLLLGSSSSGESLDSIDGMPLWASCLTNSFLTRLSWCCCLLTNDSNSPNSNGTKLMCWLHLPHGKDRDGTPTASLPTAHVVHHQKSRPLSSSLRVFSSRAFSDVLSMMGLLFPSVPDGDGVYCNSSYDSAWRVDGWALLQEVLNLLKTLLVREEGNEVLLLWWWAGEIRSAYLWWLILIIFTCDLLWSNHRHDWFIRVNKGERYFVTFEFV